MRSRIQFASTRCARRASGVGHLGPSDRGLYEPYGGCDAQIGQPDSKVRTRRAERRERVEVRSTCAVDGCGVSHVVPRRRAVGRRVLWHVGVNKWPSAHVSVLKRADLRVPCGIACVFARAKHNICDCRLSGTSYAPETAPTCSDNHEYTHKHRAAWSTHRHGPAHYVRRINPQAH